MTAPIIAASRLRMGCDGIGVTTLVCFHGCPLRCKYCLNPFALDPKAAKRHMTPRELYEETRLDSLYFLATGGGVTFGGGEPLLYPQFIREFRSICGPAWHLCAETSLSVPEENVRIAAQCIDTFYIDCKDLHPNIYRSYTGGDVTVLKKNLSLLLSLAGNERIILRLPIIPGFNNEDLRSESISQLRKMGFESFDLFCYRLDE